MTDSIQELIDAKREMEKAMVICLYQEVQKFKKKTGRSPDSISVYVTEISSIAQEGSQYRISDVKTTIDLGDGMIV